MVYSVLFLKEMENRPFLTLEKIMLNQSKTKKGRTREGQTEVGFPYSADLMKHIQNFYAKGSDKMDFSPH